MIIHFRTVIYVCKNLWSVIRNQWICRRALAATGECFYPDLPVIATVFDAFCTLAWGQLFFADWVEKSRQLPVSVPGSFQWRIRWLMACDTQMVNEGAFWKRSAFLCGGTFQRYRYAVPPSTIDGKRLIFDGFLNFQKYARITPVNSSNLYWR